MTVCLIIPPSPFLLDERVFMSLGILRVAAVLERANHVVQMLDLSGIINPSDVLAQYCATTTTDTFGITATTPQLPSAVEIARTIKRLRPDAKIILGGPHVTLVNAARKIEHASGTVGRSSNALDRLWESFDVLVAGDGEEAVFAALESTKPTLIDADDPASPLFLTNARLQELPFPARHLVDVDSYRYAIDGERALSLIAQLGCPFECGFCGGRYSPTFRRVRMRSSEHVVSEIIHLYRTYGVRGFMMYDDELNVNRQMLELMSHIEAAQQRLDVRFHLRGFIKSELFTEEQARAMYRAGFRWILVGFESGAPHVLESMRKKATRDDNSRCIDIAHRHGLQVKALMSIGHPGESEETVAETQRWLIESRPDDIDIAIITTYPGTPYHDLAQPHVSTPGHWTYTDQRTGARLHSIEIDHQTVANYFKGRPDGGYQSFVYTDFLDPAHIVTLRDEAERTVRSALGIAYNPSAQSRLYEHSMGQSGLPASILRTSNASSE